MTEESKEQTQSIEMVSDPISMHRFNRNQNNPAQLQKELDYMRDLFNTKLPVGEDTTKINSYFDYLQEVLDDHSSATNPGGSLHREDFPEDIKGRNYQYFSSFGSTIGRSSNVLFPSEQDMESSTNQGGSSISAQADTEIIEDSKPILPMRKRSRPQVQEPSG